MYKREAMIMNIAREVRGLQLISTALQVRILCLAVNIYDQTVYGVQCDDFVQTGIMFADRDAAAKIAVFLARKYYINKREGVLSSSLIKKAWKVLGAVQLEQMLLCDVMNEMTFEWYVKYFVNVNMAYETVDSLKLNSRTV